MPFIAYLRALHVGGFLATLVLMLGKFDVITPDHFETLYAPAAWCCYNVWGVRPGARGVD